MEATPCGSRHETKSTRPMPASRQVHPNPRRRARSSPSAARPGCIAPLPATGQPGCATPRGQPWQRGRWSEDAEGAAVPRSRHQRLPAGASSGPGDAGTEARPCAAQRRPHLEGAWHLRVMAPCAPHGDAPRVPLQVREPLQRRSLVAPGALPWRSVPQGVRGVRGCGLVYGEAWLHEPSADVSRQSARQAS